MDILTWIQKDPTVQAYWSATLQTFEGHSDSVTYVAFFSDGKLQPGLCVLGDWVVEGNANILLLIYDY
jgi:hypothetical protein